MSMIKRYLDDLLYEMTLEQRIKFAIYTLGMGSEDARDYAMMFEPNQESPVD